MRPDLEFVRCVRKCHHFYKGFGALSINFAWLPQLVQQDQLAVGDSGQHLHLLELQRLDGPIPHILREGACA